MVKDRDVLIQEVDTASKNWRQGDSVLGDHWFVYRFDPQRPLTSDSVNIAYENNNISESEVNGFVIVTQTCDIVRTCKTRSFIELVPLVKVDTKDLNAIQKCRQPQYAYISGVAEHNLVADLDRVMTVEKAVILGWQRIQGCKNDQETRALGQALARKRIRFAFPDEFNQLMNKLQDKIKEKHNKQESQEGKALRSLREIRVCAEPSWDSPEVQITLWFIRHEEQNLFENKTWNQFLEKWLDLIPESEHFKVDGVVTSLEDITAKDYVESDPLDLDHLSS